VYDLAALEAELAGTVFAGKLHFFCRLLTPPNSRRSPGCALCRAADGSVYFAAMSSEPAWTAAIHAWHSAGG